MSHPTTCWTCSASLAPDQRYCLSCGARVAAPRLDFLAETERAQAEARNGSAPVVAATAPAPAPAPSWLDKLGGPMGVAAIVLVALGAGFLIGQGRDEAPAVQRAPIVNIEGALPSGATAAPPSDVPAADGTTEAEPAGDGSEAAPIG